MPRDEELISAYLDGVGELTADERKRVEALLEDPAMRADADASRDLLGKLRALPDEGTPPDWNQLAHQIRMAVGPTAPRAWWKKWLVPVTALATTAAVAVLWLRHPEHATTTTAAPDAGIAAEPAAVNAMWLDGEIVDLDDLDPDAMSELDLPDDDDDMMNLDWIEQLDDRELDRAERWLDRKKT